MITTIGDLGTNTSAAFLTVNGSQTARHIRLPPGHDFTRSPHGLILCLSSRAGLLLSAPL